jgi:hypothetical protein
MESIAGYKYSIKGNNIEIPIKKYRSKNEYGYNHLDKNNYSIKSKEEK